MLDTGGTFARLLPLEGGFNLRDMGGYEVAQGGRVKHGMLYRSGTMTMLTATDEHFLANLGIVTVCDLRRPGEREAEPTRWCESAGTYYWSRDYTETSGVLSDVIHHTEPTADAMRAAMKRLYRFIPTDHAPSYRHMFERLLEGHVPLLFNCAAGKDRTGVGAALILHALGVSRDSILADYLLTNEYADFGRLLDERNLVLSRLAISFPAAIVPLLAADAEYLEEMFDELNEHHGGVDAYLADTLGIDQQKREQLRAALID